jgi:hypothetical protein
MQRLEQEGPLQSLPGEIEYWRSVWRNVHRELPSGLFHYTDAAGLRGIIKSGRLWATHIYYLNDTQEFKYATGVINDLFQRRIDQSSGVIAERLVQLHNSYNTHVSIWQSLADAYVVCFCADGNLLSQWRAYAANGEGFAIEFEPRSLMEALKRDPDVAVNAKIFQVIYERQSQRQFVELAIEQLVSAMDTNDPQQVLGWVPLVFSEMAFCFKHDAFIEEQEWRLVFIPRSEHFLDVRISRGHLSPYASIQISELEERPPYISISHGPTLEARNTQKSPSNVARKSDPKVLEHNQNLRF